MRLLVRGRPADRVARKGVRRPSKPDPDRLFAYTGAALRPALDAGRCYALAGAELHEWQGRADSSVPGCAAGQGVRGPVPHTRRLLTPPGQGPHGCHRLRHPCGASPSLQLPRQPPVACAVAPGGAVRAGLGWCVLAPGVAGGWPGAGAWGLPGALARDYSGSAALQQQHNMLTLALEAAANVWSAALRSGAPLAPPARRSGTAAAAASAGPRVGDVEVAAAASGASVAGCGSAAGLVSSTGTAFARCNKGAALGSGALGGVGTALSAQPCSGATSLSSFALAYGPAHMYKLCKAVMQNGGEECVGEGGSVGLLVECLVRLPPAAAARDLPQVWRWLLDAAVDARLPDVAFWHAGQLLSMLQQVRAPRRAGNRATGGEPDARASGKSGGGCGGGSGSRHGDAGGNGAGGCGSDSGGGCSSGSSEGGSGAGDRAKATGVCGKLERVIVDIHAAEGPGVWLAP